MAIRKLQTDATGSATMKVGVWGDGFIGRNLAITLAEDGSDVCILNRQGRVKAGAAISDIPAYAMPFEANEQEMCGAMRDLDVLVHCAGNPQQDYAFYYDATLRMARAAIAAKVSRVIVFSTVAVYGNALPQGGIGSPSVVAKSLPPQPSTHYAVSRFKTETDIRKTLEAYGVALTVVRIPMVIGPDMNAVVFKRLADLLRWGIFPDLTPHRATLPCICVRRLSQCLSRITIDPSLNQPMYQFSDSVAWADIAEQLRLELGLRFRALALPGKWIYAATMALGQARLGYVLRTLMNTAEYADDSLEVLGPENADRYQTNVCVKESIGHCSDTERSRDVSTSC